MENKKNIVIGILVVLLLCVVGLCIYLVVDKSNSANNEQKEEIVENKTEELSVNDELVQSLYKKIDVFKYYGHEYFGYIFKTKMMADDIDNKVKLFMAFISLGEEKYLSYNNEYAIIAPASDIEKSLNDIFGNVYFRHMTFNYHNGISLEIHNDYTNNLYSYRTRVLNGTTTIGAPQIHTRLIKAIKNDKDIELYQMMFYKEDGLANGKIYKNLAGTVVGTTEFPYNEYQGEKIPPGLGNKEHYEDKILDMYKDKLDTYKYTFKYNEEDDKYYFYSVERI